jgi:aminopeptidase YwaD
VVKTNPFEGGSDHTPFLNASIPGLLLWHFTDQFYHTDNDRLDKVSQKTLQNVGTAALVSALTLLNGNEKTAEGILELLMSEASKRLQTETELSRKAISAGSSMQDEKVILDTWFDFYQKTFDTVIDLVPEPNEKLLDKINTAKTQLALPLIN